MVLFVTGRILLQLAQFDAVVFADPAGERAQLMPNLPRGQVGGMDFLFELPHLAADPLRVGRHGGALGGDRLALGQQLDSPSGERLFVQIPLRGCPFRSEDVSLRFVRALGTSGQFLAAFRDCPAPLLLALQDLPHAGAEVAQPFLALGQIHLGLRSVAAAGLPVRLESLHLQVYDGQPGFHVGQGRFQHAFLGVVPASDS